MRTTTRETARGTKTRALDIIAPHAFTATWFVEQAMITAAVLAGYAQYLREVGNEDDDERNGETCPRCEGSGRTECACTRWSSDGEGCGACGYTGRMACPACRGGGRAVRVLVKLVVPETPRDTTLERDRTDAQQQRRVVDAPIVRAAMATPLDLQRPRAVVVESTPQSEGRNDEGPSSSKDDDFYAQSGEAIRVLREDYPYLLSKEPRWGIYRDDIGLVDETMTFSSPGRNGVMAMNMSEYKRLFKLMRIVAAVLFSQSAIEVSRIWSPLGSSGVRTIRVRWSVRGKVRLVGSIGADEARFDGISEYKLDSKGFIYEHKITDLDWDVAQLRERVVSMMRAATAQPQRYPPVGSGDW